MLELYWLALLAGAIAAVLGGAMVFWDSRCWMSGWSSEMEGRSTGRLERYGGKLAVAVLLALRL